MRRASSRWAPSEISIGAAPVRPDTARCSALASSRPGRLLVAGHQVGNRLRHLAVFLGEHAHEGGIVGRDAAVRIHRGDAERRRLEQPRDAHIGFRTPDLAAGVGAAVEHENGGHAAATLAAADQLGGEGASILAQQVDVELARARAGRADGGPHGGRRIGRQDVEQRQRAPGLRAQAQPVAERGVHMRDASVGHHGEQALRQPVVERQRRLQPADRLDLAQPLARDVGRLPDRQPVVRAVARRRCADAPTPAASARCARPARRSARTAPRRAARTARPPG